MAAVRRSCFHLTVAVWMGCSRSGIVHIDPTFFGRESVPVVAEIPNRVRSNAIWRHESWLGMWLRRNRGGAQKNPGPATLIKQARGVCDWLPARLPEQGSSLIRASQQSTAAALHNRQTTTRQMRPSAANLRAIFRVIRRCELRKFREGSE